MGKLLLTFVLTCCAGVAAADAIDDAVANPNRSTADRERDQRDHPAELLRWFGVKPGMTVVDMFAGGGYYSALLGQIVGSDGRVYMHNNAAYLSFAGKAIAERFANGPLPNVVRLDAEIGALGIPDASVDMVLLVMGYHDLFYKAEDWSVDPTVFFADVNAMLKPSGVLAIVDHAALPGTGSSVAEQLHRIDEAFAQQDIESRGFRLTGSTDLLRNPADDHTKSVFDPSIRGHTDRFVMRFVKTAPETP